MSLPLRNPWMLALIVLTVLAVAVVLLSAVGHINALHMVGTAITPLAQYRHG